MSEDSKRPGPDHEPDLNALAAHAEGRLDPVESAALLDHLSECSACRATAALMARALWAEPSVSRSRIPEAARWLALAATLLLATIVGLRIARERPEAAPASAPAPQPTISRPSPVAAAVAEFPPAASLTAPPPTDRRRGGGERKMGDKTFRLVAGEWVDAAYTPAEALPVVEAAGPEERRRLVDEHPALAPYLTSGDRILVVLDGTVYRVRP